jgi:hypothetical protein
MTVSFFSGCNNDRAPARQMTRTFFLVVITIAHPPDRQLELFFPVVITIAHPPDRRLENPPSYLEVSIGDTREHPLGVYLEKESLYFNIAYFKCHNSFTESMMPFQSAGCHLFFPVII